MILTFSFTRKGYENSLGRSKGIAKMAVLYPSIADGLDAAKSFWQTLAEGCCPYCRGVDCRHGGMWRLGGVDVSLCKETIYAIIDGMNKFSTLPQAHHPTREETLRAPENAEAISALNQFNNWDDWARHCLVPPRGGWHVALAIPEAQRQEAQALGAFRISGVMTFKELPRSCEWIYGIQSRMDSCFKKSIQQIAETSSASGAYNKVRKLIDIFSGCSEQFAINCGDSVNDGTVIADPLTKVVTMLRSKLATFSCYNRLMTASFVDEAVKEYNEKTSVVKTTKVYFTDGDSKDLRSAPLAEFTAPWDPMNSFAVAVGGGIKADVSEMDLSEEL